MKVLPESLQSAMEQTFGPRRDAETLAFLMDKVRPEVRTDIQQAVGRTLAALDVVLIHIEQVVTSSPDFDSKLAIMQDISTAQNLCADMGKYLSSGRREE